MSVEDRVAHGGDALLVPYPQYQGRVGQKCEQKVDDWSCNWPVGNREATSGYHAPLARWSADRN